MTSVPRKPLVKKVEFNEANMCVELLDGRRILVPLVYFPRLLQAKTEQRQDYIISGGGMGLHWDCLDEDISVENLLLGIFDFHGDVYKTA